MQTIKQRWEIICTYGWSQRARHGQGAEGAGRGPAEARDGADLNAAAPPNALPPRPISTAARESNPPCSTLAFVAATRLGWGGAGDTTGQHTPCAAPPLCAAAPHGLVARRWPWSMQEQASRLAQGQLSGQGRSAGSGFRASWASGHQEVTCSSKALNSLPPASAPHHSQAFYTSNHYSFEHVQHIQLGKSKATSNTPCTRPA